VATSEIKKNCPKQTFTQKPKNWPNLVTLLPGQISNVSLIDFVTLGSSKRTYLNAPFFSLAQSGV
jgi:hypothetical protein